MPIHNTILTLSKMLADRVESPASNFMWSSISAAGALLSGRAYLPFGRAHVHTNMYILLIGGSGSCKSDAIKTIKHCVMPAMDNAIIEGKCHMEAFVRHLAERQSINEHTPAYVCEDEFAVFVGTHHNAHFIDILGSLWDISVPYPHTMRSGEVLNIPTPLISMYGAMTPSAFHRVFPPAVSEQGFLSRLILVHAPKRIKRVPFPDSTTHPATSALIEEFRDLARSDIRASVLSEESKKTLTAIYSEWTPINDTRFAYYSQRRFTHLLKLCITLSRMRDSSIIGLDDVLLANTMLSHAEHYMPVALGSLGEARTSATSNKVLDYVRSKFPAIVTNEELFSSCAQDMSKLKDMQEILESLIQGGRIESVGGGQFVARAVHHTDTKLKFVDWSLLEGLIDPISDQASL